ncbi:hypothetical protein CEXT_737511 [Caerostris extrusa]|uniref:Uncharacterized protein n=1 Tax=Caerostris extrusa TaxID=172846 RepID=A0AAV4TMT4_CAEEX|nr:hypothetical protein CEXT_737511 [Caerostris extrusa]
MVEEKYCMYHQAINAPIRCLEKVGGWFLTCCPSSFPVLSHVIALMDIKNRKRVFDRRALGAFTAVLIRKRWKAFAEKIKLPEEFYNAMKSTEQLQDKAFPKILQNYKSHTWLPQRDIRDTNCQSNKVCLPKIDTKTTNNVQTDRYYPSMMRMKQFIIQQNS